MKTFLDKQKLRELVAGGSALQEIGKVLQAEGTRHQTRPTLKD